MFAMTAIKGIGRRFSNLMLKIAQIDLNKRYSPYKFLIIQYRAGELTEAEIEKINDIIARPTGILLPHLIFL